jgi:hypothetical protein
MAPSIMFTAVAFALFVSALEAGNPYFHALCEFQKANKRCSVFLGKGSP